MLLVLLCVHGFDTYGDVFLSLVFVSNVLDFIRT